MNRYQSSRTGQKSLDPTVQYPYDPAHTLMSSSSSSSNAFNFQEVSFDHIPADTRNPWSQNSRSHRSSITKPLLSPDADRIDCGLQFTATATHNQTSPLEDSGAFDAQFRHREHWEIPESIGDRKSLGTHEGATFGFQGNFLDNEEDVGPPGFGLARVSSTPSEEEFLEPLAIMEGSLQRHNSISQYVSERFNGNPRPPTTHNDDFGDTSENLLHSEWNILSRSEHGFCGSSDFEWGKTRELTDLNTTPDSSSIYAPTNAQQETFQKTPEWTSRSPTVVSSPDISTPNRLDDSCPTKPRGPSGKKIPSLNSLASLDNPTTCTNCFTQNTPLWRRGTDGLPMCNACGLFVKLHGTNRPPTLKTDVIKRRNRRCGNTSSSCSEVSRSRSYGTNRRKRFGETTFTVDLLGDKVE